jgi:hypothetical protein
MKRLLLMIPAALVINLVMSQPAEASVNTENLYNTGSAINLVLLLCALVCLVWSLKILSLVRGGLLSKSWQMFVLGFGFLLLAQILLIAESVELFSIPAFIATALYLLMGITWLVGLYQTRKILG